MKKFRILLFTFFGSLLISGFPATNSFALDGTSKKFIQIKLTKDADKNGFKIWERDKKLFFKAINVEDPRTKKPLEGMATLKYYCDFPLEAFVLEEYLFRIGYTNDEGYICISRTEVMYVSPQLPRRQEPKKKKKPDDGVSRDQGNFLINDFYK